jgi:hypothetical protein
LVLGGLTGGATARGSDAEAAVKEAEARLRASEPPSLSKERKPAATAPVQENFFTKLANRLARPEATARSAPKVVAKSELPPVTVRGSQASQKSAPRGEGADLGKLVAGILMRLGPMQLEESDDAVMNPSADSLALLAHPNIQPVIPVAPVPIPGSARAGRPKFAPNPLTEHRSSWLVAKVAEKLDGMAGSKVAPEPAVEKTQAPASEGDLSREKIELMALLAVSGGSEESPVAVRMATRSEPESRISALSLLTSVAAEEVSAEDAAKERPSELKEFRRFPGQHLEPIPAIKPAREIESANRTKVLMLLQPEKLAGAP